MIKFRDTFAFLNSSYGFCKYCHGKSPKSQNLDIGYVYKPYKQYQKTGNVLHYSF